MYSQIFVHESSFIQSNPHRKQSKLHSLQIVYSHNGILFNKNELSTDTCNNMMNLTAMD